MALIAPRGQRISSSLRTGAQTAQGRPDAGMGRFPSQLSRKYSLLAIRDRFNARKSCRYRPQRLATISLTVLSSTGDPPTPTRQPSHTRRQYWAPGCGAGRIKQAEPDCTAVAARTAGGVPGVHGRPD